MMTPEQERQVVELFARTPQGRAAIEAAATTAAAEEPEGWEQGESILIDLELPGGVIGCYLQKCDDPNGPDLAVDLHEPEPTIRRKHTRVLRDAAGRITATISEEVIE